MDPLAALAWYFLSFPHNHPLLSRPQHISEPLVILRFLYLLPYSDMLQVSPIRVYPSYNSYPLKPLCYPILRPYPFLATVILCSLDSFSFLLQWHWRVLSSHYGLPEYVFLTSWSYFPNQSWHFWSLSLQPLAESSSPSGKTCFRTWRK